MLFKTDKKIILASQSPRRKQLMQEAGISFEVFVTDIDEDFPDDMEVSVVPEYLAKAKANAAQTMLPNSDAIIIASDCVVILDNIIYGKPTDYEDACRILRQLSGKQHQVVTGVAILEKDRMESFSSTANVFFNELSDEEIKYYVTNYKPYDKAGAYAIQEWIGLCKIAKIEGTYATIMGLPMDLVYEKLKLFL